MPKKCTELEKKRIVVDTDWDEDLIPDLIFEATILAKMGKVDQAETIYLLTKELLKDSIYSWEVLNPLYSLLHVYSCSNTTVTTFTNARKEV